VFLTWYLKVMLKNFQITQKTSTMTITYQEEIQMWNPLSIVKLKTKMK
jgi:hypothetical protein